MKRRAIQRLNAHGYCMVCDREPGTRRMVDADGWVLRCCDSPVCASGYTPAPGVSGGWFKEGRWFQEVRQYGSFRPDRKPGR